MENMLDKALKVARSDTVKASGKTLFKDIIGILMYDPNAAWSMLEDVKKLSSTIRDGIFFECLETYILYSYRYNEETNQFESENLQSLAGSHLETHGCLQSLGLALRGAAIPAAYSAESFS